MADTWDFDDRLQVALDAADGVVVVRFTGEVDSETAPGLESALRDQLPATGGLVADLLGVDFIASAGLNALVVVHREATAAGTPFAVVAAQRPVLRPITLLGLDSTLTVRPTVAEARTALPA